VGVPKPQMRAAYRILPTLLCELRAAAGLSQRELAGRLRVAQNTVHRMEIGSRRCDAVELIQWARACAADPIEAFKVINARTK